MISAASADLLQQADRVLARVVHGIARQCDGELRDALVHEHRLALLAREGAGRVDQELLHGARHRTEEVAPGVPLALWLRHEAEVDLVHHHRGLELLPACLAGDGAGGHGADIAVDDGPHLVGRLGIALGRALQKLCDGLAVHAVRPWPNLGRNL
jgi:hypothetical protein